MYRKRRTKCTISFVGGHPVAERSEQSGFMNLMKSMFGAF
jgi:hypothetical protein